MQYLNLGCGSHYSTEGEWTNLDFVSRSKEVIAHNLLKGIPFADNRFEVVYHSHVLEHFSKASGARFISECYRVLKPGGILRFAIPDLEQIARNYLKFLELGLNNPDDRMVKANYEWMMLELYDQTVRTTSGGAMSEYLSQDRILNEEFVYERLGEEGRAIRKANFDRKNNKEPRLSKKRSLTELSSAIVRKIKNSTLSFRDQGEIHQWMYDKYSITKLLSEQGFKNISFVHAFESSIPEWERFRLDGKDGITRKPDSLFTEAVK